MRVLAHRGNRLHAPENPRTSLVSAYQYRRPEKPGDQIETFPHLLGELPADAPKVAELKHDSSLATGRRDEFVKKTCDAIREQFKTGEVVLYSKDPDNLRLARAGLPGVRTAAFDWELPAADLLALMEELGADGVVIELGKILGSDGQSRTRAAASNSSTVSAGLAWARSSTCSASRRWFTREEYESLGRHAFVWSLATDSMPGDFAAEVSYEASRVGQATTLEMAAVNVPPAANKKPTRDDGSRFVPGARDKSNLFDPHGAPPFAGVVHDGYRINSNSGTATTTTGTGGRWATARPGRGACGSSAAGPTSPRTTATTTTLPTGSASGSRATTRSTTGCCSAAPASAGGRSSTTTRTATTPWSP